MRVVQPFVTQAPTTHEPRPGLHTCCNLTYTHAYAHTQTCTQALALTRARAHTHTHTHTYVHTGASTQARAPVRTPAQATLRQRFNLIHKLERATSRKPGPGVEDVVLIIGACVRGGVRMRPTGPAARALTALPPP